jgi:hypothetical protein
VKAVSQDCRSESTREVEVEQVELPMRLKDFSLLKEGWLDGLGKAPPKEGIQWLSDEWRKFYPDDLPQPYAYPTPEGDVQLEWTLGKWELSAEINLIERNTDFGAVNVVSAASADEKVDLKEKAGWDRLIRLIRSYASAPSRK